jgi:hypothetical protein
MSGDLHKQGFQIGDDRKDYPVSGGPVTKTDLYCSSSQSKKQLVAIVVDDVWQKAREIIIDGKSTAIEGDSNDFELHLESL